MTKTFWDFGDDDSEIDDETTELRARQAAERAAFRARYGRDPEPSVMLSSYDEKSCDD